MTQHQYNEDDIKSLETLIANTNKAAENAKKPTFPKKDITLENIQNICEDCYKHISKNELAAELAEIMRKDKILTQAKEIGINFDLSSFQAQKVGIITQSSMQTRLGLNKKRNRGPSASQ